MMCETKSKMSHSVTPPPPTERHIREGSEVNGEFSSVATILLSARIAQRLNAKPTQIANRRTQHFMQNKFSTTTELLCLGGGGLVSRFCDMKTLGIQRNLFELQKGLQVFWCVCGVWGKFSPLYNDVSETRSLWVQDLCWILS